MSARIRTLVCVALLGVALGCPPPPGARDAAGWRGKPAAATVPHWVDPDSAAARQVLEWRRQGRGADAELLEQIAERPVATWPRWDDPRPDVERAVASAATSGHRAADGDGRPPRRVPRIPAAQSGARAYRGGRFSARAFTFSAHTDAMGNQRTI